MTIPLPMRGDCFAPDDDDSARWLSTQVLWQRNWIRANFMTLNSIYEAVKRATVAIVAVHAERLPKRPFDIAGSGSVSTPRGLSLHASMYSRRLCLLLREVAARSM